MYSIKYKQEVDIYYDESYLNENENLGITKFFLNNKELITLTTRATGSHINLVINYQNQEYEYLNFNSEIHDYGPNFLLEYLDTENLTELLSKYNLNHK